MSMIGQNKLIEKLNILTLDSMPRSLILLGEKGCGKHIYSKLIADKLGLELKDITENLNLDYLIELRSKVEPFLYIIDASNISIKEQNIILKFLEEPLKNSYIVLLCEDKNYVLETIWNRCQRWRFEFYNKEDLKYFNDNEDALNIFKTPGKLLNVKGVELSNTLILCNKIIDKIGVATLPNTLTIPNNIALKNEKDKIDISIFNDILNYVIEQKILKDSNPNLIKMYNIIREYLYKSKLPKIDFKPLLDNLLINLWEVSRSGS